MSDNQKYYYLKIKENFFDNEEMKILESQKNGIQYQNLYMKLCLLSLKEGGRLMFKGFIPYDETMLSTILRVDIDTVKTGIELLIRLKLIEIMPDGALYMADIQSLIGKSSTEAERVAKYREKVALYKSTEKVQICSPELEIELKTEKELEKDKPKSTAFRPPTLEEVTLYCQERSNTVDPVRWMAHYESNGFMVGKVKMKDWKAAVRTWEDTKKPIAYPKTEIPWEETKEYYDYYYALHPTQRGQRKRPGWKG
jgi:predicted phage replisome organizer